ncbi:MAG TPA: flavodoxin family protein [Elusimicrobiales bacterium]|nr:flavodoxin family protein [Elusimicrobiales bacterium]
MARKIVAVSGSYRRGGTIDRAVAEVLEGAREAGAETELVNLLDKNIGFCDNCRGCCQPSGEKRGPCVKKDDMAAILDSIDSADGIVLAAPVNCFNVTAIFRRFMERMMPYAWWPWGAGAPRMRLKARRPAALITSSAMPSLAGRVATGAMRALKGTARAAGFRPAGSLFIGMSSMKREPSLTAGELKKARSLGRRLAAG